MALLKKEFDDTTWNVYFVLAIESILDIDDKVVRFLCIDCS